MVDDFRVPERKPARSKSVDDEPAFVPPEKIAQEEELIDMAATEEKSTNKEQKTKTKRQFKNPFPQIFAWYKSRPKKQQLIIAAIVLGVLLGTVIGVKAVFGQKPAPKPVAKVEEKKEEPPKPTTEASKLTGVQVPFEQNKLPVIGIMIENSPDARPQSGLTEAGVVFEAVAEGGITRFLALFQSTTPDHIGPVRSVRPYYLTWLRGFDAPVGHVGGSAEALEKIRNEGIKDMDQFYNPGPYSRVNTRYAPHNVYTSMAGMLDLAKGKGWTSSNFTGFPRKEEKAIAPAAARVIDFAISSPLYNVHYDYDATTNSYKRFNGGQPHTDERSGQQISPKVVIALIMGQGIHPDGVHTAYQTHGSGEMFVFQDGAVTHGTWVKGSDTDQFEFADDSGAELKLNPGQTWISIVGSRSGVTYAP